MNNQYTKRARIFIGMGCNARCKFCYYHLAKKHVFWPKAEIFRQLDIAKREGMEGVDFSGGEMSIHPDCMEITRYAKEKGFKVIGIVTNGLKIADEEFASELVNAGMNDFLFSIHGHNKEDHDMQTQIPGSFEKIIKAINLLKNNNVICRINCTVTKLNYKSLTHHAELYNTINPLQVNFILFNDFDMASSLSSQYAVSYADASPYIKEAIDILKPNVKYINVRYIPHCFMAGGYEKHVSSYPQKIFDPFEWSQRLLFRFSAIKGVRPWWRHMCLNLIMFWRGTPVPNKLNKHLIEDAYLSTILKGYVKSEKCKTCVYNNICQGLEKGYYNNFGDKELTPTPMPKELHYYDPMHFRDKFYRDYSYDNPQ